MGNEFDLTAVENFEEFLGYPQTSGGIPRSRGLSVVVERYPVFVGPEAHLELRVPVALQDPEDLHEEAVPDVVEGDLEATETRLQCPVRTVLSARLFAGLL